MMKKDDKKEKKQKLSEEEIELLETGKININWSTLLNNFLK